MAEGKARAIHQISMIHKLFRCYVYSKQDKKVPQILTEFN